MNEKEKKIKEQRLIEATKKGLMGISGKLGIIVKILGQPLIHQSDGGYGDVFGYSSTPFYAYEENDEIQTIEVLDDYGNPVEEPNSIEWNTNKSPRKHETIRAIGWIFDSLNSGINMEIRYITENSELTVQFNGVYVYRESEGDLRSYVPSEEWESKVESLYKKAKKINENLNKNIKEEKLNKAKKDKESWLDKVKKNWGF
jgi:hypothetical protein